MQINIRRKFPFGPFHAKVYKRFLNAEIPKLDNNWPSGIVKLYRDGDYIGQRNWSNTSADTVQMSFGQDEQIQVNITDLNDIQNPARSQSETQQKKTVIALKICIIILSI